MLLVLLAALADPAFATDAPAEAVPSHDAAPDPEVLHGKHRHETAASLHGPNLLAIRVLGALSFPGHGPRSAAGVGARYAYAVLPESLELEVVLSALWDAQAVALPLELLLETPLRLGGAWEVHVGGGPRVQLHVSRDGAAPPALEPGLVATADLEYWATPQVGLVVETTTGFVVSHRRPVPEVELGAGWAFRF